jgi:hypothetical protein
MKSQSMPTDLIQRVDHLMGSAIGLMNQWVFLQPLIRSKIIWEDLDSLKAQGLHYLKSINLRYLVLNVASLWQEECANNKGNIKYLLNSIPAAQCRLPNHLPEPKEGCHEGRKDCIRDLKLEQRENWISIKTIRDKSIAHSELQGSVDGVQIDPYPLSEIVLPIDELSRFVSETLVIIDGLNHVVRGAGFCWRDHARYEMTIARGYFGVSDFNLSIAELDISI